MLTSRLMFYRISPGGVPLHVFAELEDIRGLVHAFTSRESDQAAGKNGDDPSSKPHVLKGLGLAPEQAIQLRQVHSARVLTPSEAHPQAEGDGLLLTQPGRVAVIKTADCLPLLLVDPESRSLCLVHAGWRGTAARAAQSGLSRLISASQANPQRLVAALGPCIRSCCYQVGPEVYREFERQGHPVKRIFERDRLDLAESNREQLEEMGVETILDSKMCTCCRPDLYYSWRRSKDKGRMWALAGFFSGEGSRREADRGTQSRKVAKLRN